ncbi:MAG: PD-(D/E)XK nuclease family protein [Firmicutes bacterium]|nr:PD-(D/E)XK nuclease family protein [Bacillota bacterium]
MIENLIKDVYKTIETYYKSNHSSDDDYNIFNVLGIAEKEVIMCRMLTDLLNPKGLHGRGPLFLKNFFEEVLELDVSDYNLEKAIVEKEHVIPESTRRIDITIEIENLFIPIEVKIDAGEQPHQCFDYYQYAKNVKGIAEPVVYYLTKYGNVPSEKSTSRGNKKLNVEKDIRTLSFKNDITRWLQLCIDSEQSGIVKAILEQYMNAIKEITGTLNMELTENIKKQILVDSNSFKAAVNIEKTMIAAKIELTEKVFEEFEIQMDSLIEKKDYMFTKDKSWYYYKDCISDYYSKEKSTWPGITYILDDTKINSGKKIIFRFEMDDILYGGFWLCKVNKFSTVVEEVYPLTKNDKNNIQDFLNIENFFDAHTFCSINLPESEINEEDYSDDNPDFREMNDAAINLVDEEYRKEFVRKTINVIQEKLFSLII